MDIIKFLTQGWILGISGAIIGLLIFFKVKAKKNSLQRDWLGSEYTRNVYTTVSKRPILLMNSSKPLKVDNYKNIISKKIRKNLIKKINNCIYKEMLINNEAYTIVKLSMVEESMLPYEYQEAFNNIFRDTYSKLVKDYENHNYDIETEMNGYNIIMKIWVRIR